MRSKKLILILILLLLIVGGIYFRQQIYNTYLKLTQKLAQIEKAATPLAQKIEKEISAPPPLRSETLASQAHLTASGIIKLTNLQRKNSGLPSLILNSKLQAAALAKAKDLFKNQYFAHVSPTGVGPAEVVEKAGYEYLAIGENLALGNFADDQAVVAAWMASPGHRANILNKKFREIGVAAVAGTFEGQKTWIAVQEFGTPIRACPEPSSSEKAQIADLNNQLNNLNQTLAQKKAALETEQYGSRAEYNQAVAEYNSLVEQYNNLVYQVKTLVNQYNAEVTTFNKCLSNLGT